MSRQMRRPSSGAILLAIALIFIGLIFLCAICCCSSLSVVTWGEWDRFGDGWDDLGRGMGEVGREVGEVGRELGRGFGDLGRELGRTFGGLGRGIGALVGCICGLWPLALIVAGVLLLVNARKSRPGDEEVAPAVEDAAAAE
ncbi:MAG: hypothetical protein JXB47_06825 [Anaerolineae bacterium]|nr:hypothetical protein [Anaerolineae bacterium]